MRIAMPLVLSLLAPTLGGAQARLPTSPDSVVAEEIRQTFRQYDAALQKGDPKEVGRFWADEYSFVNPAGQRVSRAERLANLTSKRTSFDVLKPQVHQERIRVYGGVVLYSTVVTLAGEYGGRPHEGDYEALVVLVKRDGRWQQVTSQHPDRRVLVRSWISVSRRRRIAPAAR